jgi:hypothetical protein
MENSPIPEAKFMELPKRWPLVTTLNSRNGSFTKDSRLVNAYAEKDASTGEYHIEKRPGFAATPLITGTGQGQGIYVYPYFQYSGPNNFLGLNYLILYVENNVAKYQIYDAAGTLLPVNVLGNVYGQFGTPQKFQFLGIPNGGAATSILFGASNPGVIGISNCYVYSNGALTTLEGGGATGFPIQNVGGFAYLNGYCYVMDVAGVIWQTTTQNVIVGNGSWGGTAYITAASDNDYGVQLARQLVYIVAIKTWTTQFFYDAGNTTGSSLSPLPGALFNFGCISSDTFADLNGTLFWATQSKVGTNRIVMVDNLQVKWISTPAVERQLDLANTFAVWYSMAYQHAGHRWYLISNTTNNVTMVYDIDQELWYLWTDYQGNCYPIAARASAVPFGELQQMILSGSVYQYDADYVYPNDYGNIVPVDIYTPNFDAGVDRIKYLSQMRFNADQTAGSQLWVRFSDDDYNSWTNFRRVDLSKKRPFINDEGSFYRRAYHFRHYANTPLRIRSVDLQMDIGTL